MFVTLTAHHRTESRHYSGTPRCKTKSQCPAQPWHFTGLKVGITPENCVVSQKDGVRLNTGPSQVRKSALLRQTMLQVKNSESGPVMAFDWAKSLNYSGTSRCKTKSQCPAQQWHFTELKVGITTANRVPIQKDRVRHTNGPSQVRKTALLRQTMLQFKKTVSSH